MKNHLDMHERTPLDITRTLLKNSKYKAGKNLGQHFLIDENVIENIVTALEQKVTVFEIGAGLGLTTERIARRADKLVCVEIDNRLYAMLHERLAHLENVKTIHADVLSLNLTQTLDTFEKPITAFGNLPYYISVPILHRLLSHRGLFDLLILMFQKEVAERIMAAPGTKNYAALSVKIQSQTTIKKIMDIPQAAFFPPPSITSSLLKFRFREDFPGDDRLNKLFQRVVDASFSTRRKTILNSILNSGFFQFRKEEFIKLLSKAGIDPDLRAETFYAEDFLRLTRVILNVL